MRHGLSGLGGDRDWRVLGDRPDAVRGLAKRGVRVALVARRVDLLSGAVTELGDERVCAFALDVSDRTAVLELPERVVRHFGRLDFVINNAGCNHRGAMLERTAQELAAILDINLVAPVLLTRAALPLLSKDGGVVNVASIAGKVRVPHEAKYSGSKFGLRAFGRALDTELQLAGSAVRLLSVCPRPVDTGFLGEDLSQVPDLVFSQPDEQRAGCRKRGHERDGREAPRDRRPALSRTAGNVELSVAAPARRAATEL